MKIAIIDLETTGLDPRTHEIIEIGCVVFDSDTLEIIDTLDVKVKPHFIEELADPKALEVNGYNDKDWYGAMNDYDALLKLKEITKDCVVCSYPIAFDYLFLYENFSTDQLNRYKICLFSMVFDRTKEIMSLKSACEYFEIEPEPTVHRAINGAMCGYKLFKALQKND